MGFDLKGYGINAERIYRNAPVAQLYKLAVNEAGYSMANNGALIAYSGEKTGRSPNDKRIVDEPSSSGNVWWGDVNRKIDEDSFGLLKELAVNFFNTRKRLYVFDGYACWDTAHRIKVRVICTRVYHALFMRNMLIRPTEEELKTFGEPDWTIYNAGAMKAMKSINTLTGGTCVSLNFKSREFVILGTEYAGEMKKGVFTVLNYILPLANVFPMHCSANEGKAGDTALFFGLSGTGKTTLSADPKRNLIGDDEHGWSKDGVFNFEGGCYAKCIGLTREKEPEIWDAIRFASVLENVVYDPDSYDIDWDSSKITENTRCSYPIEYIDNAKIPCVGGHPKNIVFLTCDAFGVLPPVARLTPGQAMYYFISGYTAKVAGTEAGVTEPKAVFSPCFGAPFLVWHPTKYAEMLKDRMNTHKANVYLVNTGWSGGAYGVGKRFSLKYTRAIIDAVLDGSLNNVEFETDEFFGLSIPKSCPNVPSELLHPRSAWPDKTAYDKQAAELAAMFTKNFAKYADQASAEILAGGPRVAVGVK